MGTAPVIPDITSLLAGLALRDTLPGDMGKHNKMQFELSFFCCCHNPNFLKFGALSPSLSTFPNSPRGGFGYF